MSFGSIYDIAGSSMQAQTMRLNTVASNMANANTGASSEEEAFKALKPVFESVYQRVGHESNMTHRATSGASVRVSEIAQSDNPVQRRYEPNHPQANNEGYVFYSNVNPVEEMADMMSASRSFQTSVDVMSRVNSMQQSLLRLGEA